MGGLARTGSPLRLPGRQSRDRHQFETPPQEITKECRRTKTEARARVGRPQTSSSPPVIFIAGRPKAALLFWFFGDFRCGALLFMVIHVIYKYKNK